MGVQVNLGVWARWEMPSRAVSAVGRGSQGLTERELRRGLVAVGKSGVHRVGPPAQVSPADAWNQLLPGLDRVGLYFVLAGYTESQAHLGGALMLPSTRIAHRDE